MTFLHLRESLTLEPDQRINYMDGVGDLLHFFSLFSISIIIVLKKIQIYVKYLYPPNIILLYFYSQNINMANIILLYFYSQNINMANITFFTCLDEFFFFWCEKKTFFNKIFILKFIICFCYIFYKN
jgi:hypothetical protein